MQVKDVMSNLPETVNADASIREAAMRMKDLDCGFAPIAKDGRLIGIVTDRDLVMRALADGISPDEKVSAVDTQSVLYCMEDDDVRSVLKNMREQHVQRLVVLDNEQDKDLVGVVTLSDIADHNQDGSLDQEIARCCQHYH